MSNHPVRVGIDLGGSSVKAAVRHPNNRMETVTSDRYADPSRDDLIHAIRSCITRLDVAEVNSVGLCLPGKRNGSGTAIEWAANLPALNGWLFQDLIQTALGQDTQDFKVVSDADAAAYDYACSYPVRGRTAAISLGTGVGLCVLDGSSLCTIGDPSKGTGIGHLGHLDVGRHGSVDRFDAHGSRNTLESYIGASALNDYQHDGQLDLAELGQSDPPISALIHAFRTVHAIYIPDRIVLLGGVGLALRPLQSMIREQVSSQLTPLNRVEWALEFGDSSYHAAQGACRLAP
ncbi:MAG: ROK family protein [Phycisphaerales bacterium]|nr:ROK family protein [Phycisphaerales bacterium]